MLPRIVGARGVCEMLGVSIATLYRMIRRGEFPRQMQLSPQRVGWRLEDIQEWINERARRASSA